MLEITPKSIPTQIATAPAGVDLPTVKRISGHKTIIMVERYAHQAGTHITEAMDKLDERYRSKREPELHIIQRR